MSRPSPGAAEGDRPPGRDPDANEPGGPANRADLGTTRRRRLRELLFSAEEGLSLESIEKILEAKRSTVIADLEHLRLSFRHQSATLLMVPPACTTCGYVFHHLEVPKAPSRCPQCKSRALSDPIFKAAAAEG